MSTASQVPGTLKRFFPIGCGKRTVIYLLRVELGPLEQQDGVVKWESPDATVCGPRPGEGLFPHLYFDKASKLEQAKGSLLSNGRAERIEQMGDRWSLESCEARPGKQERRLWLRKVEVESGREVVVEAGVEDSWEKALGTLQEWLM